MVSIPASELVNVVPSVISAAGTGLDLNGLLLTQNPRVPVGAAVVFETMGDVADYFGHVSDEAVFAQIYFRGYNNSTMKPGALLFVQYPAGDVAAYLRGGPVDGLTLPQLQAITGPLSVTIDGVVEDIAAVDLTLATSFSNAAELLTTQLAAVGVVVSYDALAGAFVITSGTDGVDSSIGFASGAAAAPLGLTVETGALLSQGAVAGTPAGVMDIVADQNQNWFSFTHLWNPTVSEKVDFAKWNNGRNNRFAYIFGDPDLAPTVAGDSTSAGFKILEAGYGGVMPFWSPNGWDLAAFAMGCFASLDFERTEGRVTLAFRGQDGLVPSVTNATIGSNLMKSGYNFYGNYATANDQFRLLQPGSITGPFVWADSYANQVWLNSELQLSLMLLLQDAGSIPYNIAGYSRIDKACADPVHAAVNFGAIRAGVTMSASQIAQVNAAAGLRISDTLTQQGWYVQIKDASPEVRAERGSPPCTLWYLDGQSVQSILLASVQVQ